MVILILRVEGIILELKWSNIFSFINFIIVILPPVNGYFILDWCQELVLGGTGLVQHSSYICFAKYFCQGNIPFILWEKRNLLFIKTTTIHSVFGQHYWKFFFMSNWNISPVDTHWLCRITWGWIEQVWSLYTQWVFELTITVLVPLLIFLCFRPLILSSLCPLFIFNWLCA